MTLTQKKDGLKPSAKKRNKKLDLLDCKSIILLLVDNVLFCVIKMQNYKKIILRQQKNIIFFKKKTLDKPFFRYYLCNIKFETSLLKGGVDYDCFIVLSKTN